jgi:hypothetical protein
LRHSYEIIRRLLCFFSDFYFPPQNPGKNIRSASGLFIGLKGGGGGGGGALKKIAPSGGRRENIWGISCEKSRFYAKKSYFVETNGVECTTS